MAKKQLISFCAPEKTPAFGGVIHFKNPQYFYEHESIPAYATHFFTENGRIRAAYLKAGVEEYGVSEEKGKEEEQVESPQETPSESPDDSPEEDRSPEDMSWPELRAYAATLTDEPIKNKKVALEVIETLG